MIARTLLLHSHNNSMDIFLLFETSKQGLVDSKIVSSWRDENENVS
jgi:hypothetical protein